MNRFKDFDSEEEVVVSVDFTKVSRSSQIEDSRSGTVTHALICEIVSGQLTRNPAVVRHRAFALFPDTMQQGRRISLAQRAATGACSFVVRHVPGDDWTAEAAELDTGTGRLDLVWRHEGGAVVIDEIKTGAATLISDSVLDQLERHRRAGMRLWGSAFVGVRCLPIQNPHRAVFLTSAGKRLTWSSGLTQFPGSVSLQVA